MQTSRSRVPMRALHRQLAFHVLFMFSLCFTLTQPAFGCVPGTPNEDAFSHLLSEMSHMHDFSTPEPDHISFPTPPVTPADPLILHPLSEQPASIKPYHRMTPAEARLQLDALVAMYPKARKITGKADLIAILNPGVPGKFGRQRYHCGKYIVHGCCDHDKSKNFCYSLSTSFCTHGKGKPACQRCKGSKTCSHMSNKRICNECTQECDHGGGKHIFECSP